MTLVEVFTESLTARQKVICKETGINQNKNVGQLPRGRRDSFFCNVHAALPLHPHAVGAWRQYIGAGQRWKLNQAWNGRWKEAHLFLKPFCFFPFFNLMSVRRTQSYTNQKLISVTVNSDNKNNTVLLCWYPLVPTSCFQLSRRTWGLLWTLSNNLSLQHPVLQAEKLRHRQAKGHTWCCREMQQGQL